MPEIPVELRGITRRDIRLVTNSWLENARKMWLVKGVGNELYYSQHHKILEQLLPRAYTLIACDPEDPDVIYGWACGEIVNDQLVLHYVYVKAAFKATPDSTGLGLGTLLVTEFLRKEPNLKGIVYTHETVAGRAFLRRLYNKGLIPFKPVYNPYLLFSTLPPNWNK